MTPMDDALNGIAELTRHTKLLMGRLEVEFNCYERMGLEANILANDALISVFKEDLVKIMMARPEDAATLSNGPDVLLGAEP